MNKPPIACNHPQAMKITLELRQKDRKRVMTVRHPITPANAVSNAELRKLEAGICPKSRNEPCVSVAPSAKPPRLIYSQVTTFIQTHGFMWRLETNIIA